MLFDISIYQKIEQNIKYNRKYKLTNFFRKQMIVFESLNFQQPKQKQKKRNKQQKRQLYQTIIHSKKKSQNNSKSINRKISISTIKPNLNQEKCQIPNSNTCFLEVKKLRQVQNFQYVVGIQKQKQNKIRIEIQKDQKDQNLQEKEKEYQSKSKNKNINSFQNNCKKQNKNIENREKFQQFLKKLQKIQKFMPKVNAKLFSKNINNNKQISTNQYLRFITKLKRKVQYKLLKQITEQEKLQQYSKKDRLNQDSFQKLYMIKFIKSHVQNIPNNFSYQKSSNILLQVQIFVDQFLKIVQKFQIVLNKQNIIVSFLQKVIASSFIEIFMTKKQAQNSIQKINNQEKQIQNIRQKRIQQEEAFKRAMKIQYFGNSQNQEDVLNIIQKEFYNFYSLQNNQKNRSNNKNIGIQNNLNNKQFNNYEFHLEPTNLAQYMQSYENRSHFLLDKFTQNQNIFIQEEKLELLLKLSRDPYLPQSSAKYISHITTLVETILENSIKNKKKQEEQKYKDLDQETREELKAWDKTFGNLILKF